MWDLQDAIVFRGTKGDAEAALVFGVFLRLFAALYAVQLGYAATQILPWCGSKGVYPAAEVLAIRRRLYPRRHLLYWPAQWLPASDIGLMSVCLGGFGGAVAYAVQGWPVGFYAMGVAMLLLVEVATMQWPWHHLSVECWWVLVFSSLSGGGRAVNPISLVPFAEEIDFAARTAPTNLTTIALRLLLFRVLFGFGKTKFSESTRKDWMYIRPFLVGVPIVTPFGLWAFRMMPRIFFLFSYGVFFFAEIIAPVLFWFPMPVRGIAAMSTVALMMGIQVTGNFGSFNALTATLALPLLLEVQWASLFHSYPTLGGVLLSLHIPVSLLLLLFPSWVAASWWQFPALVRGLPTLTRVYESLSMWGIMQPYGIFPAPIFSAHRNMPRFDVSDDGKQWEPLRYKFQPTSAEEPAGWCPLLHPMLDFVIFYPVGYGGFMKCMMDMRSPASNIQCRPSNAIARAILRGGPILSMFRSVPAFLRTGTGFRAPKFVRVVVVSLQPPDPAAGSSHFWHELAGTVEIPPVSLQDMDGPWLPPPFVPELDSINPTLLLWRRRCEGLSTALTAGFQNSVERNAPAVPDGGLGATILDEVRQVCQEPTLLPVVGVYEAWRTKLGVRGVGEVQTTLRRAGLMMIHALEGPYYFDVPKAKHHHFDVYLYGLAHLRESLGSLTDVAKRATVLAELEDRNKDWFRQGVAVLVFMFPTILQVEASVYRRLQVAKQIEFDTPDDVKDAIAPVNILMRYIAKALPFPGEVLHAYKFDASLGEYVYDHEVRH